MRIRSLIISATLISAFVLALAVIAVAADNPNVGTWKMNPAKSKFSSPPLKSFTAKIEAQDNGFKVIQDVVDANGNAFQRSWAAKYNGKEYPVTAPDADMFSCTRPDANTTEYMMKKNGKEVWKGKAVVSKDGKTRTDNGGGKDANGQAFTYTVFMEKQ
jgi:hypothetical protein